MYVHFSASCSSFTVRGRLASNISLFCGSSARIVITWFECLPGDLGAGAAAFAAAFDLAFLVVFRPGCFAMQMARWEMMGCVASP